MSDGMIPVMVVSAKPARAIRDADIYRERDMHIDI